MDALGKYSVQNLQNCFPVQECVAKRRHKFLVDCITSDNILCCICQSSAARELNLLHQPTAMTIS